MRLIKAAVTLFLLVSNCLVGAQPVPDTTVLIPMRDGTQLQTDIYLPKSSTTNSPCVLMRSPAGRTAKSAIAYTYLTDLGYTVAIQETRSAMDKAGKTIPYWHDGWGAEQDGYDTVEWLATSEYSNGKIGTIGASALGITQLLMAPTAPPALKCQYIGTACASLYHDATFPGGQFLKNQVEGWLKIFAKHPAVSQFISKKSKYDSFWRHFNSTDMADKVSTPAIHYGGWYDIFSQGTIDAFLARQENGKVGAKGTQKLLIGPWTHLWPAQTKFGDFEVPTNGRTPSADLSAERWFDHYLKEQSNGVNSLPAVTYYVMGTFDGSPSSGNVWRQSESWPIPAKSTSLYLSKEQQLSEQPTQANDAQLPYAHSIDQPVPTIGGRNLFIESGPKDQRPLEERKDVVVFTSDPLQEDWEVTGRIAAKIFCSSDQPIGDLVVRLTDVYPDGKSILIADGLAHYTTIESQNPQEVAVDLWSTSMVFAKGHRIRISISNSNYPRYELCQAANPSTPIHNALYFGDLTPSRLILPLVRRGDLWLNEQ